MKSFAPALLTLCLTVLASTPTQADQALAQKKVCLSCHGVDKRNGFPAPSYKEVSARYAGQKDAADKLVPKILRGGTGAWGVMTMPANPQVTEAEARQLAAWILSVK
ncbi:MAG: c-type cytochrome [Pseudomonadota bacterium]